MCGSAFALADAALSAAEGDYVGAGISLGAAAVGVFSDAGAAKVVAKGVALATRDGMEVITDGKILESIVGGCFVSGTLVQTSEGLRPIEAIAVGDLVAARDERTGDTSWKPVVRLFRHTDQQIVRVTLVGDAGEETLGATPQHPFWVLGQGWTGASELKKGERVLRFNGNPLAVVEVFSDPTPSDTFNFEVEEVHSYFVGTFGAWVHNASTGGVEAAGNWKSVRQFGHTFSEHGAGAKNTGRLVDRARGTGNPQGQWLNNEAAAEILGALKVDGPATFRIPKGLGQVIKPDGTIVTTEWATAVPRGDGLRTAFPVLGP